MALFMADHCGKYRLGRSLQCWHIHRVVYRTAPSGGLLIFNHWIPFYLTLLKFLSRFRKTTFLCSVDLNGTGSTAPPCSKFQT